MSNKLSLFLLDDKKKTMIVNGPNCLFFLKKNNHDNLGDFFSKEKKQHSSIFSQLNMEE